MLSWRIVRQLKDISSKLSLLKVSLDNTNRVHLHSFDARLKISANDRPSRSSSHTLKLCCIKNFLRSSLNAKSGTFSSHAMNTVRFLSGFSSSTDNDDDGCCSLSSLSCCISGWDLGVLLANSSLSALSNTSVADSFESEYKRGRGLPYGPRHKKSSLRGLANNKGAYRAVWSAPYLLAYRKVTSLDLLRAKF